MSKYVFPGICAELDANSEQLNPPRVALDSGTKQSYFARKYVKIVPKELAILSGTRIASCNDCIVIQSSDKKFHFRLYVKRI